MTRKYKQAAKRRNKTAVQKYRRDLNNAAYEHWGECCLYADLPRIQASLWQRITGWFKR